MLALQLLVHPGDLSREVMPIRNDALAKPRGGLWTSTYDPRYGSAWVQWCVAFRYNDPLELHWTVCTVPEAARIAVIETQEDLARLFAAYPRATDEEQGIDFERLSKDYDGLHLTREGYLRHQSSPAVDGWDCESTLWFQWTFTTCHEITPSFPHLELYDELWKELTGWSNQDYQCHKMPAEDASCIVYETMLRDANP